MLLITFGSGVVATQCLSVIKCISTFFISVLNCVNGLNVKIQFGGGHDFDSFS